MSRTLLLALALVSCTPSTSRPADPPPAPPDRAAMTRAILGTDQLPQWLPDAVEPAYGDLLLADVERIRVGPWTAYYLPAAPGNDGQRLAIWHQGHRGDVRIFGREIVWALHDAGWSVLACSMPTALHDQLELSAFVEPVVVALNYCASLRPWTEIRMAGLSGGGWTTMVVAALDERITSSVPVAGSYPPWLRDQHAGSYGDREQRLTYGLEMDLYRLAAAQPGGQVQVLNRLDPCCFPGRLYDGYAAGIPGLVVVIDDLDRHEVGPGALAEIVRW